MFLPPYLVPFCTNNFYAPMTESAPSKQSRTKWHFKAMAHITFLRLPTGKTVNNKNVSFFEVHNFNSNFHVKHW